MGISLKTEELNNICSKILSAVDSQGLSEITETIELIIENNVLYLQVTNREYFVKIKLNVSEADNFHATVNAELFLKLISKITTEYVTFEIKDNCLIITGNGNYKLPLVYDGSDILKLPEITINNVTNSFDISGITLNSIYLYNSKQFSMGTISNPIQSLYYVDKEGAITFTNGACVNKFSLAEDVKLLFNSKVVKLFRLFKANTVKFTIGQDIVSSELTQTKVQFETSDITLTAILPSNDTSISKVPVQAIRERAFKDYDYTVVVNRSQLLQAINRLFLFSASSSSIDRNFGIFEFKTDNLIIKDINKKNSEEISYSNSSTITDSYTAVMDFSDVKLVLESSSDDYINMNFGDNQAVVFTKDTIYNIIPEIN